MAFFFPKNLLQSKVFAALLLAGAEGNLWRNVKEGKGLHKKSTCFVEIRFLSRIQDQATNWNITKSSPTLFRPQCPANSIIPLQEQSILQPFTGSFRTGEEHFTHVEQKQWRLGYPNLQQWFEWFGHSSSNKHSSRFNSAVNWSSSRNIKPPLTQSAA